MILTCDSAPLTPPIEYRLNLGRALALRLGYHDRHEHCGGHHARGKDPEGDVAAQSLIHQAEALGHDEHQRPVEHDGDRGGDSLDVRREQLAHHHPRNRPEAQREAHDVQDQRDERQPADVRHVRSATLQVVEDADNGQADAHHDTALQQQDATSGLLDEQRGAEGHEHLHHPDDDRAQRRVHRAAGRVEDGHRVEYDGVDAGHLLEQHQAQADDEGDAIAADSHQVSDRGFAGGRVQVALQQLNGGLGVALGTPQRLDGEHSFVATVLKARGQPTREGYTT